MSLAVYEKVKDSIPKGIGVFIIDCGPGMIKKNATSNTVDPEVRLNIMTRMAYRSAAVTLHARKSKTSGAELVALTAVEAIQGMAKAERKNNKTGVIQVVAQAISKYV